MKGIRGLMGVALAVGVTLGVLGGRILSAQDPLKSGKVLQRTELISAKGTEAILVLRDLPPGGESGKHTQTGNEIVYILEGSVVLEVQGKPAVIHPRWFDVMHQGKRSTRSRWSAARRNQSRRSRRRKRPGSEVHRRDRLWEGPA